MLGFAFLVVAAGIGAGTMEAVNTRSEIDTWTAEKSEVVESVVQDLLDRVFSDLEAMAGFIEQSDPSIETFGAFADRIDGTANSVGVGYIFTVAAEDVEDHIAERKAALGDFYEVFGLDPESALPVPVNRTDRTEFYPVQLFAFGELVQPLLADEIPVAQLGLGVDGGSFSSWREEIGTAYAASGRHLSSFIALETLEFSFDRAFFASVPVEPSNDNPKGIVASVMLEPLLLADVDTKILDDVQWEVVPIGGEPERIDSTETRLFDLRIPNTPWRLAVAPTDEALAELTGRPAWVVGLSVAGAAALVALSLWLLIDRRGERNRTAQMRALATEKDRFLATVSHELRTPLTVVAGVASEIRDHPSGFNEEELGALHTMIVEETDELTAIVEDLLVAARSDISNVAVTHQPVDIVEEIQNAIRTSAAPASIHGVGATALADPQRVRQILRNLLTNAKRYGGDQIRIDVEIDGAWVDTVVADSGDGIPAHKQQVVFEPYESAHRPGTQTGSVGLGLYVSRALARAMGGELDYTHSGSWSRFRLRLPAAGDQQPRNEESHAPANVA